jgi:YHS domain-containing protein
MTTLATTLRDSPTKTIDPVCGMEVEPDRTKLVSVYKGRSYWFCAQGCRHAFEANPDKYLKRKPAKDKGWFGRWLDRMAKSNQEVFGCAGPKCH